MVERQHRCIGIAVISIMVITLIIVLGIQLQIMFSHRSIAKSLENFERQRESMYLKERFQHLGGKYELSTKEMLVNNRILTEKLIDKDDDHHDMLRTRSENDNFTTSRSERSVFLQKLYDRPLFKLLQTMPKGAALHVKDFAMCSLDCLVGLTYHESLWICENDMQDKKSSTNFYEYEALFFSHEFPKSSDIGSGCRWILLKKLRSRESNSVIDQKLRAHFTFRTGEARSSLEHFEKFVHGLLTYEPIWVTYLRQSLDQFKFDNIFYIEIFSTLPELYNLERSNFTFLDTARVMRESIRSYCAQNQEFVGAMVIYEPPNKANDRDYNKFLQRALRLKRTFPDFFAGINLASNAQVVSPLYYLSRKLIALQDELDFFYHVDGIQNGVALVDENLIDAVLLGSKRITYDTGFLRHPELLRMVRRTNVAIEICPTTIVTGMSHSISELHDHPSSFLFAAGYPVIITSDYPSSRNSTQLTHDFYIAFVSITSKAANLGTLKELAWNSLQFSSSHFVRKQKLFSMWSRKWDKWIDEVTEYEF